MGESFGIYQVGDDEVLMPLITVANVACGFHASDYNHMHTAVRLAKQHGVQVGAHPGLPDMQGFGRREMKMDREELTNCLIYQIGALKGFLAAENLPLSHIKPHGSLYGMAARDEGVAHAICDAAEVFQVPLFGMIGCQHEEVYEARSCSFVSEYFCDLEYDDNGALIITRTHDAQDAAREAKRALRAVREGLVESINGKDVQVRADTICVHSDTPNAAEVVRAVRIAVAEFL